MAGWAPGPCPIGVDLELVEPRTPAFVSDFFTGSEARRHADLPPSLQEVHAVVVWSAKEAALKVARTGLRRDTRGVVVDVEIEPPDAIASGELVLGPWRRLVVEDVERNVRLQGGFRRRGELVLTWLRDTARPNGASSDQAPREAR